jgi:glycosyltransferase domain-containing protein
MHELNSELREQLLSNLTIVIISYNRPKYLKRNLLFWNNSSSKVIVLDGSTESLSNEFICDLSKNIEYFHLPISLQKRLERAIQIVDTPYVTLLGDDEFILPSALALSIFELENDKTLVSCIGRAFGFGNNSDKTIYGYHIYPKFKNRINTSDNPGDRMFEHMSDYATTLMYSVVRLDIWKLSYKAHCLKEFPLSGMAEIQFELTVCYCGKSKVLPVLHWLRSDENDFISDSPDISLNRNYLFYDSWIDPEKFEMKREFLYIMSTTFSKIDGRHPSVISKEIERAMDAYARFCIGIWGKKQITIYNKVRLIFLKIFPKILTQKIRSIISYFRKSPIKNDSFLDSVSKINQDGVYVDYKEITRVYDILIDFHK